MDKRRRPYPDKAKEKIRTTKIINRLNDHALGKIEMTPTQIQAAKILIAKTLPDLKSVEGTFQHTNRPIGELTEAELERIAAGGRTGDSEAPEGEAEPSSVH